MTVKSRVRNYIAWMQSWGPVDLFGAGLPGNPALMAPDFLINEAAWWWSFKEYRDYSHNCLSQIEPVKEFKVRDHLRKAT